MPKSKRTRAGKKKNLGGRPPTVSINDGVDLNPETETKIKEALQKGLTRDQACDFANISRSSFYDRRI